MSGCPHTGRLIAREDGKHCEDCGALIYAASATLPGETPPPAPLPDQPLADAAS
ncbi:hypothetical protein [Streptomyces litchfieldiae]|uniref:Uncharacterized protein n=1 Tax=Streptomyces litchfieldiae TaxID=3075543 RepID=A0ABU2MU31_9ACTN|nr:hypothetical protein [Streptomyces sp. DSM 44938]MDT0345153.1 hypothetical protein [Streptomyces sp. DSM 44938]